MNQRIIDNWKSIVKPNDIIWNLGDVAMCEMKDKTKLSELINSLPGHKKIVLGNHDNHNIDYWYDVGFEEVYSYPIIYEKWYILSHEPIFLNTSMPYINIHGHIHNVSYASNSYINCSVEVTDYKPINLDEIIKKLNTDNKLNTMDNITVGQIWEHKSLKVKCTITFMDGKNLNIAIDSKMGIQENRWNIIQFLEEWQLK
jgi:calcineurin-like phosphoesterase family protein